MGFYGDPDRAKRPEAWNLLRHLSSLSPQEWLCIGNFNEITDNSEKVGGLWRSDHELEGFRNSLSKCNLGDMGFSGSKYTWSNKRNSMQFIKERLDSALATPRWCNHFPFFEVEVLATRTSDHKPL
jgi:hypothetical protein